ncbi:MAG: flgB [Clostridia bacterium]|nr:flgB [Clostridia bacterium]
MDLFHNIDIINKALDATMLRYSTISNNISNQDTPGYKRKDVAFEGFLEKEIERKGIGNISINTLNPKVYVDNQNYAYRMDGNNVDIDVEMAESAKVKLKYDTLIERTSAQLARYKSILQTIK